jgi:hypothetical protein
MQIKVKFVNEAKDGKKYGSIVGQDDTRYPCPKNLVGRFVKGQTYEIETKSETWGDKDVTVISGVKSNGNGAAGGNGLDKWWMPFVSNTVAHAIQVGEIKEPAHIKVWAAAAKRAAEEIAAGHDPRDLSDIENDMP